MNPTPTFVVHAAMIGWFPFCIGLFAVFGPLRAVALGLIIGLFALPNATYEFSGIPDYDKTLAIGFGVAVAAMVMDSKRFATLRFSWIDLPVVLFCVAPFLSAIKTGYGTWWGLSESFSVFIQWGVPWWLGRLYVSSPAAMRYFAIVLVGAALVYLPFCLFEIRMSPRLHEIVYGIRLRSFKHAARSFGWRPNVFMVHGLKAAMVLSMAALTAYWLWASRAVRQIAGIPIGIAALSLALLTAATQSANALLMLLVGGAVLFAASTARWRFPLLVLALVPPVYIGLRWGVEWRGEELVELAKAVFGERRSLSLDYRLENEAFLAERSKLRPWLGYSAIADLTGGNVDESQGKVVTDSMWLILVATFGLLGLAGAFGVLLLAPFLQWKRCPVAAWRHPMFAPMATFSVIVTLHAIDCLLNAYPNAVFIAMAGGVAQGLGTRRGRSVWGLM